MDESKEIQSLRERIASDFAELESGENAAVQQEASAQGEPMQEAPAEPAAEPAPEQPVQQEQPAQETSDEMFSQPAQAPAQPAQPDMLVQFLSVLQAQQAQIAQLQQQLAARDQAMSQQSQMAEEAIDNSMTQPAVEVQMPALDTTKWDYMGDADRQAATAAYNQQMGEYINSKVRDGVSAAMADIAPIRRDYEEKRRIAANDAAKSQLYSNPQFADFKDNDGLTERIISVTPGMENLEPSQRYLIAGLAARGYRNNPQQISAQQLVDMVRKNPDAMKMLDVQRAQDVQQKNASAPPIVPSTGMSTASAIPNESPKTMDDLRKRVIQYFR